MAPSFGTSGLRGLVTELTDDLIQDYVDAFLAVCPHGGQVMVARDLRASSPAIADRVLRTIARAGLRAVDCGAVPTPALALASLQAGAAAIMVTGSHIPADRNGLKFYSPSGEITKDDEGRIVAARGKRLQPQGAEGGIETRDDVAALYMDRYVAAFGSQALAGLRLGVYRHSSVARDMLEAILHGLGAQVVALGQSDGFIPIDTEAVPPDTQAQLRSWVFEHGLDAILSTDGDGDRPLLVCGNGALVPGDTLGVLTAQALSADTIVTPVSTNDMVRRVGFDTVELTRIGSPFVIASMVAIQSHNPTARVVGFEPNGGFLLGFDARERGDLPQLVTRDAVLPMLAPLALAQARSCRLGDLVDALPACHVARDLVREIDPDRARVFLAELEDPVRRDAFCADTGTIARVDRTDGLRFEFEDGVVIHLRPSGNAPEFRIYAQAAAPNTAQDLAAIYLGRVAARLHSV